MTSSGNTFGSRYVVTGFGVPSDADKVRALEAHVQTLEKMLKTIDEEPQRYALVIGVRKNGKVALRTDAGLIEVPSPAGLKMKVGDTVRIHPAKFQILDVADSHPLLVGGISIVTDVLDADYCEVALGMEKRVVMSAGHELQKEDRVILDGSNLLVIRKLPKAVPPLSWDHTALSWDDIGGCEQAKAELIKAIERPYKNRKTYERYGQRPARGILLHGSPGCGKTMLGAALATSIAREHGHAASTGFMYVKGPEVLNKFVGESESAVRALFARARAHKAEHGYPAVIFIDEADAILGSRDTDLYNNSMSRTVVPQFLSEMGGLQDSGAFVLLATNRPSALDPAIVRDERIDRRIHIGRPDRETAQAIFDIKMRGKPSEDGLSDVALDAIFDPRLKLLEVELRVGSPVLITFGHTISGAMVSGIVQRAVERAIDRELAGAGETKVSAADIEGAVNDSYKESFDVDHGAVVLENVSRSEIANIRKVMHK